MSSRLIRRERRSFPVGWRIPFIISGAAVDFGGSAISWEFVSVLSSAGVQADRCKGKS